MPEGDQALRILWIIWSIVMLFSLRAARAAIVSEYHQIPSGTQGV